MRLALEVALARAGRPPLAARRTRWRDDAPGKLLATIDPGAVVDAGRAAAARARRSSRPRTARRRRPRSPRRSSRRACGSRTTARARTSSRASPRRCSAARTPSSACFEVDEGAFPDVARRVRPRAVCLGNLFRDQLDRYGELEHVAERWRAAVRELPDGSTLVVNADDPQVGDLATERPGAATFGLDDPAQARPSLQHAADSKYCLRCGTPYAYAAAYVGHLGDYRCPACGHARPPLDVVGAGGRAARARGGVVRPGHARGHPARRARRSPGSTTSTTRWPPPRSRARSARASTRSRRGWPAHGLHSAGSSGSPIGDRRVLLLLIKNPAGANEVVRTLVAGGAPRSR